MGWLATVGKCVGYLFGRSTQRADFEAVYKQMNSLATRLAKEIEQHQRRVEELEKERDAFRDTMLEKFDTLYRVNDECHQERRELLARVAELESRVHRLQNELAEYRTDSNA